MSVGSVIVALLALGDQLRHVGGVERAAAGEDLVEHQAERVDVAARRDLAAGELLGRHVGRRAGAQHFAGGAGEAEVGDPDLAAAVEHDVRRLEIAMDDAAIVRGGEPGADLPRELDRAVLREAADAAEQRREILAVHVFHREERVALEFADVVDAADVRVRHLPRHPHFGVELRQARGIAIDRLRAGTSARPAGRASGRRRDRPRPCRLCRGARRCGSGRRAGCRARSGRGRSRRWSRASRCWTSGL